MEKSCSTPRGRRIYSERNPFSLWDHLFSNVLREKSIFHLQSLVAQRQSVSAIAENCTWLALWKGIRGMLKSSYCVWLCLKNMDSEAFPPAQYESKKNGKDNDFFIS
jgi:hypothetical protein